MTKQRPLVSLENASKSFGETRAMVDVDLAVHPGELVGLLGPNGAGKTTVLSVIQGLRALSSGRVRLFGEDPRNYRSRALLGCTPQESALPATLRVGEVINFVGSHFANRVPAGELADEFGLTPLLKRQCGSLSGGQKRRLSVALAFAGRPSLVLLDEPTTGLDVDGRRSLWDAVRRQREAGATILLTSHYLEEIEALAERVIVMQSGRIVADDSLSHVLSRVGLSRITVSSDEPERTAEILEAQRFERVDATSAAFFVSDSDAAITRLVRSGTAFSGLGVRGATLEEAFLTLTDSAATDPAATTPSAATTPPTATKEAQS